MLYRSARGKKRHRPSRPATRRPMTMNTNNIPSAIRKKAAKLVAQLEALLETAQEAQEAAQAKFDGLSERAQAGKAGERAQEKIDDLGEFMSEVESAKDSLEAIVSVDDFE